MLAVVIVTLRLNNPPRLNLRKWLRLRSKDQWLPQSYSVKRLLRGAKSSWKGKNRQSSKLMRRRRANMPFMTQNLTKIHRVRWQLPRLESRSYKNARKSLMNANKRKCLKKRKHKKNCFRKNHKKPHQNYNKLSFITRNNSLKGKDRGWKTLLKSRSARDWLSLKRKNHRKAKNLQPNRSDWL